MVGEYVNNMEKMFEEKKKYLYNVKWKAEDSYNRAHTTNKSKTWELQMEEGEGPVGIRD